VSQLHETRKEGYRERGILERFLNWILAPAKARDNEKIKPMSLGELKQAAKAEQKRRLK
jgi:hypothetical protein